MSIGFTPIGSDQFFTEADFRSAEADVGLAANTVLTFGDFSDDSYHTSSRAWIDSSPDEVWTLTPPSSATGDVLQAIINGTWDASLLAFAVNTMQAGPEKPAFIRLRHEQNGNWQNFRFGLTGYSGAKYIAAYQHVVTLLRGAGLTSKFMWSPNVTAGGADTDFASTYPGDPYVDRIGLDGYSSSVQPFSFEQLFDADLTRLEAVTTMKPVWITETGYPNNISPFARAIWIKVMFEYLRRRPRVVGLQYWTRDHASGNCRLSDADSQAAFLAGVLGR